MELRPYQSDLLEKILFYWFEEQCRRLMLQLPTGGGKTVIFASLIENLSKKGLISLILVHREELIQQAVEKLRKVTRKKIGIIKAGYKPNYKAKIQVASVPSLIRRLHHLPKVDVLIVDEAHHTTAESYRKCISAYENALLLGVTATPIRLDGTGFRDLYDELIVGPSIKELTKNKYLSRLRLFADANPMTTKGVRMAQSDYSVSGLAKLNDAYELSGELIESYRHHADGRQCVVFAINVEHSKTIAERYQGAGIPAAHLDASVSATERKAILEQFRKGKIKVLCNCALFDEGFDLPELGAVQIAKPTASLTRWLQMIGRSLRPSKNKDYAIILDHTKNWAIHGLPTREREWTLDGVKEEEKIALKRDEGTGEVKEVEIAENDVNLTEISETTPAPAPTTIAQSEPRATVPLPPASPLTSEQQFWLVWWEKMKQTQQTRGYKPGWLYYRLQEQNAPLFLWYKYAQYMGYHPKWVEHHFRRQKVDLAKVEEIVKTALKQLSLITQAIFKRHFQIIAYEEGRLLIGSNSKAFRLLVAPSMSLLESILQRDFNLAVRIEIIVLSQQNPGLSQR